ncbi:MAG: tRNA (N(6)-L-threonylcarbamoyladenosine(37)-C(2))-methylthiotransferase MtaB [Tepidisphaeraceae bacterium]
MRSVSPRFAGVLRIANSAVYTWAIDMRKFSIQTLGCKVNHYESEQMASLLRSHGWVESGPDDAELRIVNTCSVTMEAASKSRQAVRRAVRTGDKSKVVVAGCWATSDKQTASQMTGVDLVLTHHDNVADRLTEFASNGAKGQKLGVVGTRSLPLLHQRQHQQQRAFLKIQDGCDAHCTYCIIPKLRPLLWSKPLDELVREATQLVDAGHVELVLTGIFLGAYGRETAVRRRQSSVARRPLAEVIDALCTRVPGLRRVRLSSLEPGDIDHELLASLRSHRQIVPHFHVPLQSGSDAILRKMNRQYRRDDFLRLVDRLYSAFDRPALTTDVIVGFPGESEAAFQQTLDVVHHARFIHVHAFAFSPRPGTAAARWQRDFVRGPVVGRRIDLLRRHAGAFSLDFRSTFVNETVQLLVERERSAPGVWRHGRCERYFDVHFENDSTAVGAAATGDLVDVRIDRVTPTRTFGTLVSIAANGPEHSSP